MSDTESKEGQTEEGSAEGAEGEGGAPKKGLPVKKILMIAVPVVLLVGGGAGAYVFGALDGVLGKKPAAEHAAAEGEEGTEHAAAEGEPEEESHGEEEATAEEDSGGGHGGGGGHGEAPKKIGPTFVKVADDKGQDLVVNLSTPDGQMRFLQLGVQLELAKSSDEAKIKAVMPRVIDEFQTYLRELRPKDLRGSSGIYRLKIELLARVNQAAAPVKVKDVLFDKYLIQ